MAKKKTQSGRKRTESRPRRPTRGQRFAQVFLRALSWGLLLGFLIFAAIGLTFGFRQLFFVHNPHFTATRFVIDIYGELREPQVRRKLEQAGVVLGSTNLFEIDLAALREAFETWEVPVKRVRMVRVLPDTLQVQIFEHEPAAQLRRPGGKLADITGVVLPESNERGTRFLPVITPVRDGLKTGNTIDDAMVQAALRLIAVVARERQLNELLDIRMIHLDYETGERMTVHLDARGPFSQGARIVLPTERKSMLEALNRVVRISQERLEARQVTGFIDATYEVNVPVRRRP